MKIFSIVAFLFDLVWDVLRLITITHHPGLSLSILGSTIVKAADPGRPGCPRLARTIRSQGAWRGRAARGRA